MARQDRHHRDHLQHPRDHPQNPHQHQHQHPHSHHNHHAWQRLQHVALHVQLHLSTDAARRKALYRAIRHGNYLRTLEILQSGLSVENDVTLLELAAKRSRADIVELLLEHKCFSTPGKQCRALDVAVWKGNVAIVELLLGAGVAYMGRNCYGETLLYVAACGNCAILTEKFIMLGCDMNVKSRDWTPLHVATHRQHLASQIVLIKHGCTLDIPDSQGNTALTLAVATGHMPSVHNLVKGGCCVNVEELKKVHYIRQAFQRFTEIEAFLTAETSRPKSLMELCRREIRGPLDQTVFHKVANLPLPESLKDFIKMKDIFPETKLKG